MLSERRQVARFFDCQRATLLSAEGGESTRDTTPLASRSKLYLTGLRRNRTQDTEARDKGSVSPVSAAAGANPQTSAGARRPGRVPVYQSSFKANCTWRAVVEVR